MAKRNNGIKQHSNAYTGTTSSTPSVAGGRVKRQAKSDKVKFVNRFGTQYSTGRETSTTDRRGVVTKGRNVTGLGFKSNSDLGR